MEKFVTTDQDIATRSREDFEIASFRLSALFHSLAAVRRPGARRGIRKARRFLRETDLRGSVSGDVAAQPVRLLHNPRWTPCWCYRAAVAVT